MALPPITAQPQAPTRPTAPTPKPAGSVRPSGPHTGGDRREVRLPEGEREHGAAVGLWPLDTHSSQLALTHVGSWALREAPCLGSMGSSPRPHSQACSLLPPCWPCTPGHPSRPYLGCAICISELPGESSQASADSVCLCPHWTGMEPVPLGEPWPGRGAFRWTF